VDDVREVCFHDDAGVGIFGQLQKFELESRAILDHRPHEIVQRLPLHCDGGLVPKDAVVPGGQRAAHRGDSGEFIGNLFPRVGDDRNLVHAQNADSAPLAALW